MAAHQGLAAAAKKAGRIAAEGLVGVAVEGNKGAVVEVNSETDFVSRNDQFQGFVSTVAKLGLASNGDLDALNAMDYPGTGRTVAEELTHLISTIGENMNIRRVQVISIDGGEVASMYTAPSQTAWAKSAFWSPPPARTQPRSASKSRCTWPL